ncbi:MULTISPECIES: hypothetical protein [unclassified Pseudomonas]|uniref:hypothetical protein n=1 Tax=unclassified Pseudomonas TaxID=196821 RepID=UPI0011F05F9E|nr:MULTISPECIES: hypothetical protein [unclassified Pseudomonas]KAA0947704.1 hypothetical protein FQ182_08335 [Pseudomonas sp. ANT_H4]KAA0951086.1 hypothetical protein FQ186_18020 [Pseudomonas sp. ANT_H14]
MLKIAHTPEEKLGGLLQWVVAHAGLSAAWFLEDEERDRADVSLQVARLAQQALAQWALVNGNA